MKPNIYAKKSSRTSHKLNTMNTLEDLEPVALEGVQLFHRQHSCNECQVYLDEPIGSPSYYRNLIHYLHNMQEEDTLVMWIDTPGGRLDGAYAIIDAMQSAEGEVQVIVTGEAASAGSLIALNAPNLVIGSRARFMLHAASYCPGFAKQGDIESSVENNKIMLRKIISEAYTGFLTDAEIELLLIGKDYYFDADEVNTRLENRKKLFIEAEDAFIEEELEELMTAEVKSVVTEKERQAIIDESVKAAECLEPKPKKAK